MGNYVCPCVRGQDKGSIKVPSEDSKNISTFDSDPSKCTEANLQKIVKIQNYFKTYQAKKKLNIYLIKTKKQFDTKILQYGEHLGEKSLESFINPEVKKILSKLEPIVPTNKDLNKYYYVFSSEAILFKNNTLYKGSWNYFGKKHGYGIYINEDGFQYEGFWMNDCFSGYGRYCDNQGYYEGNWLNGQANGKGKLSLITGYSFNGEWKNDTPNGNGIETNEDGNTYQGEYVMGNKQGNAVYKWKDGASYQGMITNGKFEGKGIFTWSDGREYNGMWKNNCMNGKGIFKWPDGAKYEGEYHDNKKEGKGVYYKNKDNYYDGSWLNNQEHGEGVLYNNGTETKGIFRYGKLIEKQNKKLKSALKNK